MEDEPEIRKLSRQTAERLMQVVRVLEELPPEKKFSLRRWYKCGAVACACGWAAADPWFQRLGFRLESVFYGDESEKEVAYLDHGGFAAAGAFFGLSEEETSFLFFPLDYRRATRRDVVRRIRRFVEKRT